MLTYDIFYTMLIVPTWLLFTSAELLEEEGRQHMSIWLYGWCLLCLLPNGLFAAAAGECLNKLSSELWFARNKASIFLIDQHSDYPHLSSRYFSGFRLAYALQLHNNSDSTQGSSLNHVDRFFAIFDPPLPPCGLMWTFEWPP